MKRWLLCLAVLVLHAVVVLGEENEGIFPLPTDALRLNDAFVQNQTRSVSYQFELVLVPLIGNRLAVPFKSSSVFRVVQNSALDGTYVQTITTTTGRMVCNVFVRSTAAKRSWQRIIDRYQPKDEPARTGEDVIPWDRVLD